MLSRVNIVDEIFHRAEPARVCLIAGHQRVTYAALHERVLQHSAWLKAQPAFAASATPRIGLAAPGGVDYIALALAILHAGACLVPIADELTESERADLTSRTSLHGLLESTVGQPRFTPLAANPLPCEAEFSALKPAFIRFSSGTTGDSKGVVMSHASLLERITAANAVLQLGTGDVMLWMLPMAHHFAVSIVLYLYFGCCTAIAENHLAADVLALAEVHRATAIYGAPFHYALLAADRSDFRWPSLRLPVSTAAALDEASAAAFAARFDRPLVQAMGIIEAGLPLINIDGAAAAPTAVGKPTPAFAISLRDDTGHEVAPGEIGELCFKGPGLFDAYLSPWQSSADVCRAGWFATGDLAKLDTEGRVHLCGRKKSVLNIGGMKVFPEEIEAVLNQHPAVKRSHAFGRAHQVFGTVPAAEVELLEKVTPRELQAWCRERLSAFKVPVQIKAVDAIALTASGKVRR